MFNRTPNTFPQSECTIESSSLSNNKLLFSRSFVFNGWGKMEQSTCRTLLNIRNGITRWLSTN